MEQSELKILHDAYLRGNLYGGDAQSWLEAIRDPANGPFLKSLMGEQWALLNGDGLVDMDSDRSAEMLSVIIGTKRTRVRVVPLWLRYAAAVVLVLGFGVGGYFYLGKEKSGNDVELAQNDIAPGRQGATLTLSDGRKILLSDALAGKVGEDAGVRINKSASGELIYEVLGKGDAGKFNVLSTARGQTSQVRLQDGTVVFLNAESSLRYPASFEGSDDRKVELSGEGYFEVAKDKAHPFLVATGSQQVEVLGTHFNVNGYASGKVATTLLEGSVRVSTGGRVSVIAPGEQAVSSSAGIAISEVEAEDAVAWKNGYFMFNSENLESIMGRLSRWYDVKVEFDDETLKKETLFGSVSRYVSISKVLKKLEGTGKVSFELEGRTVRVTRK